MIEFFGSVAAIAVAAALFYSLWFAKSYLEDVRLQSLQKRAYDAYQAYLLVAFDNPDYARSEELESGEPLVSSDEHYVQYALFVTYLLQVCDQVLQCCPDDIQWQAKLKQQLIYHRTYLVSPEFQDVHSFSQYSPELQAFLKDALNLETVKAEASADSE